VADAHPAHDAAQKLLLLDQANAQATQPDSNGTRDRAAGMYDVNTNVNTKFGKWL
jgi:hypothetical protein